LTKSVDSRISFFDRAWSKANAHAPGETVVSRKENAMQKYSEFFQTLHDEQSPTGYLGQGTHYSILRALVFQGPNGEPLPVAKNADFAVIWDEDHDIRVIEPIEKIYRCGLLSSFLMFGESKGVFTAVLTDHFRSGRAALLHKLNGITQQLEDPWPARAVGLGAASLSIVSARAEDVMLYLRNLVMLWNLGVKSPFFEELAFSPILLKKIRNLQSEFSVRTFNCLNNDNIVYLGDLVQRTDAEMLRTPNFGRKSLSEIKERLEEMGLHLGYDPIPGWPPENIESLAQRFEEQK
jgi:hypothetical protein